MSECTRKIMVTRKQVQLVETLKFLHKNNKPAIMHSFQTLPVYLFPVVSDFAIKFVAYPEHYNV